MACFTKAGFCLDRVGNVLRGLLCYILQVDNKLFHNVSSNHSGIFPNEDVATQIDSPNIHLKIVKNNENVSLNVVVCLSRRYLLCLSSTMHSPTLTRAVIVSI